MHGDADAYTNHEQNFSTDEESLKTPGLKMLERVLSYLKVALNERDTDWKWNSTDEDYDASDIAIDLHPRDATGEDIKSMLIDWKMFYFDENGKEFATSVEL